MPNCRTSWTSWTRRSKPIKGQLEILQFERAPIVKLLLDLERALASQNKEIVGIQTQLGKITDENAKLKAGKKRSPLLTTCTEPETSGYLLRDPANSSW